MRLLPFFAAVVILNVVGASASAQGLSIGSDKKTDRPNVFIAWRNTHRILEVEIEVKNLSPRQAQGELKLQILDEDGNILDYGPHADEEPINVTLPPAELGGREGRILQMHGTKEINQLIDRLDRANERYSLRAMVVQQGEQLAPNKNVVAKTFNVDSRLRPAAQHFYAYYFTNTSGKPVDAQWQMQYARLPQGWELTSSIENGSTRTLSAGETVQGVLYLRTPNELRPGQHIDVRVAATVPETGELVGVSEWYAVYNTSPPTITDAGYELDPKTGAVSVHVTAVDNDSMLKEASGARVEYSTDGGTTFSSRVLAYADGNFVGPTRFLTDLGPFATGTHLAMTLIVESISGNKTTRILAPVTITQREQPSSIQ